MDVPNACVCVCVCVCMCVCVCVCVSERVRESSMSNLDMRPLMEHRRSTTQT
jgi:hypothetical protein